MSEQRSYVTLTVTNPREHDIARLFEFAAEIAADAVSVDIDAAGAADGDSGSETTDA